jgi:excisionase family DNA binding protein
MGEVIPFPEPREPLDGQPPDEDSYQGPVPDIDPDATLYTLTEVAYLLNLSREVTAEYLTDGTIPGGSLIGGGWLVSRRRLEAWLDDLPREGGAR